MINNIIKNTQKLSSKFKQCRNMCYPPEILVVFIKPLKYLSKIKIITHLEDCLQISRDKIIDCDSVKERMLNNSLDVLKDFVNDLYKPQNRYHRFRIFKVLRKRAILSLQKIQKKKSIKLSKEVVRWKKLARKEKAKLDKGLLVDITQFEFFWEMFTQDEVEWTERFIREVFLLPSRRFPDLTKLGFGLKQKIVSGIIIDTVSKEVYKTSISKQPIKRLDYPVNTNKLHKVFRKRTEKKKYNKFDIEFFRNFIKEANVKHKQLLSEMNSRPRKKRLNKLKEK